MADVTGLEEALRARALELMDAAVAQVVEDTAAAAPYVTGELRARHTSTPAIDTGRAVTATITADTDYAQYVAEGTSAHIIRPVHAQALRFEIAGQVIYATVVHHPGNRPNTEWWSEDTIGARFRDALEAASS